MERQKWSLLPPLTVLYAAYGVARAMCLLGVGGARKPRTAAGIPPHAGQATELLG
jgi:hypothetical protein